MTDSAAAAPAPAAEEPGVVPYLGARIRLISNANIAYEGSLYTLNSKEATIALQNVRCFGTEDRVADPADFIAPSDDVYEFIVFRGQDIKDLRVLTQQPAAPRKPPQDPAILSTKAPPNAPAPAAAPQARANDQSGDQYAGPGSGDFLSRPPRRDNRPNDRPPRRDHHGHGSHGQGHGQWREPNQAEVVRDFDFEQANARFNKEEFLAGIQGQGHSAPSENKEAKAEGADDKPTEDDNEARARAALAAVQIQPLYDKKKSFFDNLSAGDVSNRPDRRADSETFGPAGAHYRSRHAHRGHGGHGQGPNGGQGGGFQRGGRGGNRQSGPREWRDYEYRDRDSEPQGERPERSDRGGRGGRGGGGRGRGGSNRGSWRSDQ